MWSLEVCSLIFNCQSIGTSHLLFILLLTLFSAGEETTIVRREIDGYNYAAALIGCMPKLISRYSKYSVEKFQIFENLGF